MKTANYSLPNTIAEEVLRTEGYRHIAGIDEAGRGALMGPVVAAAVIMPEILPEKWNNCIRDSKLMSAPQRNEMFDIIIEYAVSFGIGTSSHEYIDSNGIAKATRMAMTAAARELSPEPDYVLVDHFRIPEMLTPHRGITHGDRLCFSIACASIIAKVTRDRLVERLAEDYPHYHFEHHKGYGTAEHIGYLKKYGPCPLHRKSFKPVRSGLL